MGPQDFSPERSHPTGAWVTWLKTELAPEDMGEDCLKAFLKYFADLEILQPAGPDAWKLGAKNPPESGQASAADRFRDRLESASRTERGVGLHFFLGRRPPESQWASLGGEGETGHKKKDPPMPERASDFSNLQIVKKVGRQLKPFLELEKNLLSRLQGPHTGKEDAQKIFNYILGKTQHKAQPRQWEQLSRRRHK